MKRFLAVFACALSLGGLLSVTGSVSAKDAVLRVVLDDRPLDAKVPTGLIHDNTAFIDVVRATKAFDGLLTFGKNDHSVNVTIRSRTAQFVVGSRHGSVAGVSTVFTGAPFNLYGEVYVPLTAIAKLANAGLTVDLKRGVARLTSASP
jgi:hypothetical protein